MHVIKTKIQGLVIIEPRVFPDERGYFFESYNQKKFSEHGLNYSFVQDNESQSTQNVLRGLHYQQSPMAQAKLVRVTTGSVLDVAVDIRPDSPTYGHSISVVLSAENKKQMLVPRGFAHGFLVLSKIAVFSYKCDNFYSKEHDRGINAFDPTLNIDWGIAENEAVISEKDKVQPLFGEHDTFIH